MTGTRQTLSPFLLPLLFLFFFLLLPQLLWASPAKSGKARVRRARPHVVVVMADDLGWSDVGYRDLEMSTANIDTLAREGVVLDSAYMQQVCTPSRSAFLSGIYPFRVGLQNSVLTALTNKSMPLGLRLLPEDLQALGYSTHYVGKWHLGFCDPRMTPTYRGFSSFYGMYNGQGDYYTHRSKWNGFDLQNNTGIGENTVFSQDWSSDGVYSTDLFTDAALDIVTSHPADRPLFLMLSYQAVHGPLQVPEHYVTKYCSHVTSGGQDRKLHCAMTAAMDAGIGRVMGALEARGMADNLITLFTSDNGGPVNLGSSNWPLRGSKTTLWEGGTRSVTILHSKTLLPRAPYTWTGLMHAVDWYPTLLRAVGAKKKRTPKGLDGVDNWRRIVRGKSSRRKEFVYNVDDVKNTAALRYKKYKLINYKPGSPDGWYNPPAGVVNNFTRNYRKYPEYMLYDLNKDPSETTDIIGEKRVRRVVAKMKAKLRRFKSKMVPTTFAQKVPEGKPRFHGGAWVSGWC